MKDYTMSCFKLSSNWGFVLLMSFFLVDSFSWFGVLAGLDFRLSYIILGIGILLSVAGQWFFLSKDQLFIFAFLIVFAMPGLILHPYTCKELLIQLAGAAPFAYISYVMITRGLRGKGVADSYLSVAVLIVTSVLAEQALYLAGGIGLVAKAFELFTMKDFASYDAGIYYRASGILYEPSQVGLLLPPALYLALNPFRLKLSAFLSVGILLSFSMLGFIGLIIALAFSIRMTAMRLAVTTLGITCISIFMMAIPATRERVEKVSMVVEQNYSGKTFSNRDFREMKGTVATLFVNGKIAYEGLRDSPVFGHGVGSFRYLYDHYLERLFPEAHGIEALKNQEGGASLFFRMLFELGAAGTGIIFFLYIRKLWKLRRRKTRKDGEEAYALAISATIFFICCLLRKDMIVSFYFWFFVSMFLVSTGMKRLSTSQPYKPSTLFARGPR